VPTLGAVWRSILGAADFSVFIYGATGRFKTALASLLQGVSALIKRFHETSWLQSIDQSRSRRAWAARPGDWWTLPLNANGEVNQGSPLAWSGTYRQKWGAL
jgi:hypothetical protein